MLRGAPGCDPGLARAGPGRPRRRPTKAHADKAHADKAHADKAHADKAHADKAHADKGYDYRKCRAACRARGIQARIARRGIESKDRLGRHRWVVARAFAWLNKQRRLHSRFARRAAHYHGFLDLACALICLNYIKGF